jgi:hypothetical protein
MRQRGTDEDYLCGWRQVPVHVVNLLFETWEKMGSGCKAVSSRKGGLDSYTPSPPPSGMCSLLKLLKPTSTSHRCFLQQQFSFSS